MAKSYEDYRDDAIAAFSKIYKYSLAFDLAGVPKDIRIRLLEDEYFQMETNRLKAKLYANQLQVINSVISGEHSGDGDRADAAEILKAIEMRNKLLFNDLNIDADDSNAVNIVMMAMNKEDFEKMETAEVNIYSAPQTDVVSFDELEEDTK